MWSVIRNAFRRRALLAAFAGAALVAGLGAISPESAQAATLYVTEYATGVTNSPGSDQAQIPPQPSVASQTVSITGASVSSSAFNAATHAVDLYCDSGCSIAIGPTPTATTSLTVLTANQHQTFGVSPGQKVAVIANASGTPTAGTVIVTPNPLPVVGTGTSGTPAGGVLTVQGQSSMQPIAADIQDVGGNAISLGQKTMANSFPVVLPSDQSSIPVSLAAGVAIVGTVGIDQTTTGTTNGVTSVPTAAATSGLTSVSSSAAESNHVIKGSPGNLYGFQVTTGATAGFVFVSNTTTAPTAAGAAIAPVKCYTVAANSTIGVAYAPQPLALSTGITIVFSTTGCFVNTASATAFISGDAK